MSKLAALRKQISALEAKAERLAQREMKTSISKVRALMHSLGVTVDHLSSSAVATAKKMTSSKKVATKKTAAKSVHAKTAVVAAKYADPKTGRTWSGRGRAPAWIASAKDRAAYLIHKAEAATTAAPAKKRTASAKAGKAVKAGKRVANKVAGKSKAAAKKVTRATKEAAAPAESTAPSKKPATKTAVAKRRVVRKPAATKAAPAQPDAASTASA